MGQGSIRDHSNDDTRAALKHTLEVADIVDELNTLKKLFKTQRGVLRKAVEKVQRERFDAKSKSWTYFKERVDKLATKGMSKVVAEVEWMIEDAERTRTSVINPRHQFQPLSTD